MATPKIEKRDKNSDVATALRLFVKEWGASDSSIGNFNEPLLLERAPATALEKIGVE